MKKFYDKSNIIADLLRENRKKKGYSKTQLSHKLELFAVYLNPTQISRIETCNRFVKDFELISLCIILDINFNDLKNILEEAE